MNSSFLESRGNYPVKRDIQTRWADNDHYGHVNNVAYYSYFDTAVNGWLIHVVGSDIRNLSAIGIVVSSNCHYVKPVSFPDHLEIGIALRRIGNSSVTYHLAVFRAGDNDICAVGEFVHVYVDTTTRRPVPVPEIILTALSILPNHAH